MDYENLTPETIERMTLDARLTLTDVLEKAGVSRGSFYRERRGQGKMTALTKARLVDAIQNLGAAA